MCVRRFLFADLLPDADRRRRSLRALSSWRQRAGQDGDAQGPFRAPPPATAGRIMRCLELARAARHGRRPAALGAGRRRHDRSRNARGDLLHPSDHLSRARPLERPARCRRRRRLSRAACSSRARRARSMRVSDIWAPRYRQAAYRRLPAQERGRDQGARPGLSRCPRRIRRVPRRPARRQRRSSSPGTARARCICRGCWSTAAPRSRAGSSRPMSSAGRCRSPPTCPRRASRRARARPGGLRAVVAELRASPPIPRWCSTAGSGRNGQRASSASATTCCAPTRSPGRATARRRAGRQSRHARAQCRPGQCHAANRAGSGRAATTASC